MSLVKHSVVGTNKKLFNELLLRFLDLFSQLKDQHGFVNEERIGFFIQACLKASFYLLAKIVQVSVRICHGFSCSVLLLFIKAPFAQIFSTHVELNTNRGFYPFFILFIIHDSPLIF